MENTGNSNAGPVADTSAPETSGQVDNAAPEAVEGQSVEATPEAKAKERLLKKFKLKVDGKEEDYEIDMNNEEELTKHFQLSKVARKRMEESAMTNKRAQEFINQMKRDPISVLKNPALGINVREAVENYLAEQIREESMSPDEKRLQQAERIIREREEEERGKKTKAETEQMEKLKRHYADDYDKKIGDALKSANLPKSPKTVQRMAGLMRKNLELGLEMEPKDLVEIVREDYLAEIKELFGATDEDTLLSLMGDDVSNKVRKADLKRLKGLGTTPTPGKPGQVSHREEKPAPRMSKDQWKAELARKIQGK